VFSGGSDDVAAMLRECRHGPVGAKVSDVVVLGEVNAEQGPFRVLTTR
jgi:hypothetical protein